MNYKNKILNYKNLKKTGNIKIVNKNFKIFESDKLTIDKNSYDGFIEHKLKEIYLKRGVKDKSFILLHEILHNIFVQIEKRKDKRIPKKIIKKLRSNDYFIDSLAISLLKTFSLNELKGGIK